jgi:hypothetical protein
VLEDQSAGVQRDHPVPRQVRRLVFEHPFRKVPVELEAPLPEYWEADGLAG